MQKRISIIILLLLAVSAMSCSNLNRHTPANMDNAAIEAEVRKSLVDDGITGLSISVDGGVVTLEGKVSNHDDHMKAINAAKKVKGVTRVVDRISMG